MSKKKPFAITAEHLRPGSKDKENTSRLQALLGRYGYLTIPCCPGEYDEATRRAVHNFQTFYRLTPDDDGVCDEQTITLLNRPRCGNRDPLPVGRSSSGRLAPYVTVGAKWDTRQLRFRYLNNTPDLPGDRQREIMGDAFNRWAEVCGLEFVEVAASDASELTVAFHRMHQMGVIEEEPQISSM